MSVDYGTIVEYSEQGFGFVARTLQHTSLRGSRVFFHIKTIKRKYPALARELDSGVFEGAYDRLGFWYDTEQTRRGDQVSDLWLEAGEIPEPQRSILREEVERRWKEAVGDLPNGLHRITLLLMGRPAYEELRSYQKRRIRSQREA